MKLLLGIVVLLGLGGAQASAQKQSPFMVQVYGFGRQSCATWLADPGSEAAGVNWALGYWSGMNQSNPRNHLVGSKTDGAGILGEIKLICNAEPSTDLGSATGRAYYKLELLGK